METKTADNETSPTWDAVNHIGVREVMVHRHVRFYFIPGYAFPFQALCIGETGHVTLKYNDTPYRLGPGDMLVVVPFQDMDIIDSSEDYAVTIVAISGQMCYELFQKSPERYIWYRNSPLIPHNPGKARSLTAAIDLVEALSVMDYPDRHNDLSGVLNVCLSLAQICTDPPTADYPQFNRQHTILIEFAQLIEQHYTESREVKYYADLLNITPKYLSYLAAHFSIGKKATEWIADHVCYQAKLLMRRHPELDVKQVARQLGFDDQSSFTRYFRRNTGMTPTRFRRT